MRLHISLPVADLDRSILFYQALLGAPPIKQRPGYAKFLTESPQVNLALVHNPDAAAPSDSTHYGLQLQDTAAVTALAVELRGAGLHGVNQDNVTCCGTDTPATCCPSS